MSIGSLRCARACFLIAVALSLSVAATADAATLRLDAGFGKGGVARVPLAAARTADFLLPLRPVRQRDGKVLVVVGSAIFHGNTQILLARFTRTGRPDPTFGRGGRKRVGLRWNFSPTAVQLDPAGRILILGQDGFLPSLYPWAGQLGLARLLPDGSPDRTFGVNGFVAWNAPWTANTHFLLTVPGLLLQQGDGRLLVPMFLDGLTDAAPGTEANAWRVAFARFDEDGSVDESFGDEGVVVGPEGPDFVYAWAALSGGRIVALAGHGDPLSWRLERFTAGGGNGVEFEPDGLAPPVSRFVSELLPTRDGGIVFVEAARLHRILPDGQVDAGFGSACGRAPLEIGAAAATSTGGLLATGTVYSAAERPTGFAIPYGPDGCAAARPLKLKGLRVGPPLLQGAHGALIGATYRRGLALVRLRR